MAESDDLDAFIAERTQKSPRFATLLAEAQERREVQREVSFWLNDNFSRDDFVGEVFRIAADGLAKVEVSDIFQHPESHDTGVSYLLTFRSGDRIDSTVSSICEMLVKKFGVELR